MVYFTTSWDDGNKLDLKIAKLLQDYSLKGTFYIPINYRKKSLKDSQIKKISKNFEIGSHGFSHMVLTRLNRKDQENELKSSKLILESLTKKPITSYAYPFGKYSRLAAVSVFKSGYTFARTSNEFFTSFKNPLLSHITLRTTNNFSKFLHFKHLHLVVKSRFKWNELGKLIFRNCKKNSVFHLSGHSYFLENENFEDELVDFFDYICKFKIRPVENFQLLRMRF